MEWIDVRTSRCHDLTETSKGSVTRHPWQGGTVYHVRSHRTEQGGLGFLRNPVICWTRRVGRASADIVFYPSSREWFAGGTEDRSEHVAVEFAPEFMEGKGIALVPVSAAPSFWTSK